MRSLKICTKLLDWADRSSSILRWNMNTVTHADPVHIAPETGLDDSFKYQTRNRKLTKGISTPLLRWSASSVIANPHLHNICTRAHSAALASAYMRMAITHTKYVRNMCAFAILLTLSTIHSLLSKTYACMFSHLEMNVYIEPRKYACKISLETLTHVAMMAGCGNIRSRRLLTGVRSAAGLGVAFVGAHSQIRHGSNAFNADKSINKELVFKIQTNPEPKEIWF